MAKFLNYYKILGVNREDTTAQIRSAYKKLALANHPDKNKGSKEAEERFKKILEAYEVLSDQKLKVDYDSEYDYETRTSTTKPKKRFFESKGGLEAPIYTDYRGEAYEAIEKALTYNKLWAELFGKQDMFGAFGHRYCENNVEPCLWQHIYVCLNTKSEVSDFRNKMLGLVATYLNELAKLKEESIDQINRHYKSKRSELNEYQRHLFNERRRIYSDGPVEGWKEAIQRACFTKDLVLGFAKSQIELIDSYVESNRRYGSSNHDSQKETEWKTMFEEKARVIEDEREDWKKDNSKFTHETYDKPEERTGSKDSKIRESFYQKIHRRFWSVEPVVHLSELDSSLWSPFSDWIEKVWRLEFDQLGEFEKQMIDAVDKVRQRKQKEKLNNIFESYKDKSGSDLQSFIDEAEKEIGSKFYKDNEEKIRRMKEKYAAENPESYFESFRERIKDKMEAEGINEQDLDKETQRKWRELKNGNETREYTSLVKSEMEIDSKIEETKANKNLNEIIREIKRALSSLSQRSIEEVKNRILEFISNPNVYCQSAYDNRRSEVQNLLSKLNSSPTSERPINSHDRFPLNVVLPIAAILLLTTVLGVIFVRQKNKKRY